MNVELPAVGTLEFRAVCNPETGHVDSGYAENGLTLEQGLEALEKLRDQLAYEIEFARENCPARKPSTL